jgi:hypothetical protein
MIETEDGWDVREGHTEGIYETIGLDMTEEAARELVAVPELVEVLRLALPVVDRYEHYETVDAINAVLAKVTP